MFIIIPILPFIPAALGAIVPVATAVGTLFVAPVVLKASKNAVDLIKDGKIGLDAQKIIKRISDYDEQIGTIVIEKGLEFDNDVFTAEVKKIKENMAKIEQINKDLENKG